MKISAQEFGIESENKNKILNIEKFECNILDNLLETIINLSQMKKTDDSNMLLMAIEKQKLEFQQAIYSKKKEELRNEIDKIHEEVETTRIECQNTFELLSNSFSNFAKDITHIIETHDLENEYTKRENNLKTKARE